MAGEDVDPKSSASVAVVPYVFFFFLSDVLPQFLVLVLALHVLGSTPYMQHDLVFVLDVFSSSSYMQMLFTFPPSGCMTCFIAAILVMLYLIFILIKSFGKFLIFPTIQKPYNRQSTPSGFAAFMRPPMFEGIHYKRWRVRAVLWFQTMSCYDATLGKPEGELDAQQAQAFQKMDTLFKAAVLSVLGENIVDAYALIDNGKDMWDALEAKFGVSDAGTELYIMEKFYNYRMTEERSMVEQAHEIKSFARELEHFSCMLPDKFVAEGIITKLPPSCRNFATLLKHKRQEFSVPDLIGTLDVEEKARAKDTRARGMEGGSSANLIQKKNFQSHKFKNKGKFDGKAKFDGKNKAVQHRNFKKKNDNKKCACHVCGDPDHWAPSCPNRYDKRHPGKGGKTDNVVIGDTDMKDAGPQGLQPC